MTRLAVVLSVCAVALPLSAALAEPGQDPTTSVEPGPGEPGSMIPSGVTRGYVQPPLGTPVPPAVHGDISKIIFVNPCRGGCTFIKSANGISDAITNQTWLGGAPLGSTITISEFAHSQEIWDETIACIRDVYSPYGVTVTDIDPGQNPHHEAVLAGRGSELPIQGALGVAPLGAGACQPANNVISFSFANAHGPTGSLTLAQAMCWTVAQESAHSYALDHEFDCSDPLTYLDGCGQKFFRNKLVECGTFAAEECQCGGSVQNSHAHLTAVLGVGTLPPPPTVNISMPVNNTNVAAGFSVFTTAIDRRGVKNIDLLINGWLWSTTEGVFGKTSPYVLAVPNRVPDGVMDVDVRACNDLDVCATQRVTVTRGAACTGADSCLAGQKCDGGRCLWDPPAGAIGDACTYSEFCTSNVCADVGGEMACTLNCFGGPNDVCPAPYACNAGTGAQGVCAEPADEGGCCSTTGSSSGNSDVVLVNLGLGALIGLVAIRRRRRRA